MLINKLKSKKGFTIVELTAVFTITVMLLGIFSLIINNTFEFLDKNKEKDFIAINQHALQDIGQEIKQGVDNSINIINGNRIEFKDVFENELAFYLSEDLNKIVFETRGSEEDWETQAQYGTKLDDISIIRKENSLIEFELIYNNGRKSIISLINILN